MVQITTDRDGHFAVESPKGKSERFLLTEWVKDLDRYVSVGRSYAKDGEWLYKKGGFAVKPWEARQLAEALLRMAAFVEGRTTAVVDPIDEAEDELESGEDGSDHSRWNVVLRRVHRVDG